MKAKLDYLFDERVARVTLAAPKANILDREMVGELDGALALVEKRSDVCAIVIAAEGPHFSFGASIEEHLPEQIEGALARLGALLRRLATAGAPTIAAVRGQCLGGGFELVLACDLIVAEENAQFGAPEIRLGVFPPAATALLPLRVGVAPASSMILTGESWSATEAKGHGLVTKVVPVGSLETELEAWLEQTFVPRSPVALRYAARGVRRPILRALTEELPALDQRYLQGLMNDPDGVEGIRAFLEKRQPNWSRNGVPA